jgi:hypothetical protein
MRRIDGDIIALDIAKQAGIAIGRPGQRPTLSTRRLAKWEGATLDEAYGAALDWCVELLAFKPSLIVIEAPLPGHAGRRTEDVALAFGLQAIVRGAARNRGVRVELGNIGVWRKFVLGHGNLPSAEAKSRTLATCRRLGWSPANLDEADAAGLWIWACAEFAGHQADHLLPLLAKARSAA